MEKGVEVRGSAAGMGCVRVRVGSCFSLVPVSDQFRGPHMCFGHLALASCVSFLFFCFFASDAWELCCREGD